MRSPLNITFLRRLAGLGAALALGIAISAFGQVPPRSLDTVQVIAPDGAATLTVNMSFDALPWRQWKALVGDEPARLRATMRHQFAAFTIDDFKLEKDDLNRTATITMRSAAGPQLQRDGSFAIPVEKDYRLVNHSEREWFFSGNNPYAANALVTTKVVLPDNVVESTLRNPGTVDQTLLYTVRVPPSTSPLLIWAGGPILLAGVVLLGVGLVVKPKPAPAATPPPTPAG